MSFLNDLLADLACAFPNKRIELDTLRIYHRELADLPDEALTQAVHDLIRSSEFFPTIRALREAAAERILGLPSETTALAEVEARMLWGRSGQDERPSDPPRIHSLVRQAVDHVGGFHAIRSTDEPAVIRGQFLRIYRELRQQRVLDLQVGTAPAQAQIEAVVKTPRQITERPVS